tara:strand:- start:33 stop:1088 length:1056 start_codon:yes stop_codon:yes gene_type:complete
MANYTTVDDASANFQCHLYSGTGSSNSVTLGGNSDLQPDLVWIKSRNQSGYNPNWTDVVRGVQKIVWPNRQNGQNTYADSLTSFNSDGFTIGADSANGEQNLSGESYVSWCWKAGGSASNNTTGDITASQSANATAGFSISTFNTSGQSGTMTCGHGLGAVPKFIIIKPYDTSDDWYVYHSSMTNDRYIRLNQENAETTNDATWALTTPTSSVFSIGAGFWGANSNGLLCYAFSEVRGYSKFGAYQGNGQTDGVFVFCGFQPSLVIIKRTGGNGDWEVLDNKRLGYNPRVETLATNNSSAEGNYNRIDILSNGFKVRSTSANVNNSNEEYIYMAWAQNPLVTSSGVAGTAR